MRHVRLSVPGIVAAGALTVLTATGISRATPPVAAQPHPRAVIPPAVLAARLGPPSKATNAARLAALGLTTTDPALQTKLAAFASNTIKPIAVKTVYPGPNGASFGSSVANVKVATPATVAALKARVPEAVPQQSHLNMIAGWPKPTTDFPLPEVAGVRLKQLGTAPTAIIETKTCGAYEVQSTPIPPPSTYSNYWDRVVPLDPLQQISGLDVVRLQSFLALVDTPQVGKLTLYGNGKFSDTINIPLNNFPQSYTTPVFSETVSVMTDRNGNAVMHCSAPWMCGASRAYLSPKSRLSTEDPCYVDPSNCNPPAVQGDDTIATFMFMLNGFKVTATVGGVDSYKDFDTDPNYRYCYHTDNACSTDFANDPYGGCGDCYARTGPHLPSDSNRSATIFQAPTDRTGEIKVRWSHAVGESISYKVRFDFYGNTSAVYRATAYQTKQTACAGEL